MMTNKKIYQQTFGKVHSCAKIHWADMERRTKKRTVLRKLYVAAVIVCLLSAFATASFVVHLIELKDMELSNELAVQQDGSEVTMESATGVISLQGFGDMPEKLAVEEWQRFLGNYDYQSVLERLGNSASGFEEKYGYYQVYTQEMADKLEEIAAKYGLKLHTDALHNIYPGENLCALVGGDFLGRNSAGCAYMYEDGTFKFDGQIELEGDVILDYQFMRCVYGTLTDVILNIGNVSEYMQWSYTAQSGMPVTLALADHKALIIADLSDSFVVINVLAGAKTALSEVFSAGALSASDLERFADSFDFSVLTPVRTPQIDQQPQTQLPQDDLFSENVGFSETQAQKFFAQFSALLENGEKEQVAQLLSYPAVITVADSTFSVESAEKFLTCFDEIFTEDIRESILINQYTRERAKLYCEHGIVVAAGGAIHFAAVGDAIKILIVENSKGFCFRSEIE